MGDQFSTHTRCCKYSIVDKTLDYFKNVKKKMNPRTASWYGSLNKCFIFLRKNFLLWMRFHSQNQHQHFLVLYKIFFFLNSSSSKCDPYNKWPDLNQTINWLNLYLPRLMIKWDFLFPFSFMYLGKHAQCVLWLLPQIN